MLVTILLTLAAIYHTTLATVVLTKTRPGHPGRVFAWFTFSIVAWILCVAVLEYPGMSRTSVCWWIRATYFFSIGVGFTWLWFCVKFPQDDPAFRRVARSLIITGIPWLYLCWTPYTIQDVIQQPWPDHIRTGVLYPLLGLWEIVVVIMSTANLYVKSQHTRGIERQQIRYMLFGFVGMALCACSFSLILPMIAGETQYAPVGHISSLILTTVVTYAIVRYRLMDIRIFIRTGMIYSITIALLSGFFSFVILIVDSLLAHHIFISMRSLSFATALILIPVFHPLRARVQALIDRRFFKSVYDYRQVVQDTSQALAAVSEATALLAILTDAITRTLKPCMLSVYLPAKSGALTLATSAGPWLDMPEVLQHDWALLPYLVATDDVVLTEELQCRTQGRGEIGQWLSARQISVAIPLIAGKSLRGLVFLGEKRSGDVYTSDDVALLRIFSKASAMALENAQQYETLRLINQQLEKRVQERTAQLSTANARLETMNDALQSERAYLAAAIDILPIPIVIVATADGGIRMNAELTRLMERHRLKKFTDSQLLDPTTHLPIPTTERPIQRALRGEMVVGKELILLLPDDREVPVLVHAGPVYVGDEMVAAIVAMQDIGFLKAADRAKDEFLAVLSHELKTPLTCILAWTEVAQYDPDLHMTKKALDIIRHNSLRQRNLLNDLLDISRIIHHKLCIHPEPIDLWETVEQNVEELRHQADAAGITIYPSAPPSRLPILADPSRISQVICNLLNNAMRFSVQGSVITVTGYLEGDYAVLEVSDAGRGIAPEALPEIFQPFRQVDRVEADGGLGLGLALVKGIVELHHGHVHAASPGEGQGSTFTVALPMVDYANLPDEQQLVDCRMPVG